MSDLLTRVLEAHGGLDRWNAVTGLVVDGSLGGPFWGSKGWPDVYAAQLVTIDPRTVDITFAPYPHPGQRSRFRAAPHEHLEIVDDAGAVLDARDDPRASFPPTDPSPQWDAIQTAYFTSCAMWNYLTAPFLFTYAGVTVQEIEPWTEGDEQWRRLAVHFPAELPNHNPDQTFYYDERFLLRRMDYHPDVTDSPIAHYTYDHETFGGLVFPTRRRVHVHGADGVADLSWAPITVDITDVQVLTT